MDYVFQYRELAKTLYDALIDDAFYMALEASVDGKPQQRREAMLRYYDYSMRESSRDGELHLGADHHAGAAIWTKPVDEGLARRIAEQKHAFLGAQMGEPSLNTYLNITRCMARQTETVVAPGSWYLSIVGVAPRRQGQGLGGRLVRPMLDRLDELGRPAYVETFTPRNMTFYHRLAFRVAAEFDVPGAQARYWVMVRDPV